MLLLTVIYIAFIGLGLPDSMFGAAWPAVYQEWGLPFSIGSYIVTIVYSSTMISSLLSAKVISRFGTNKVAAYSTALTALAMLGFSLSGSYPVLCLMAVPLGIGAGAIDTALNDYVATHFTSRHMSFMHCFYGVGVVVSPLILSQVMKGANGWRNGYRIVFLLQALIATVLFVSSRLWKENGESGTQEKPVQDIPLSKVLRIKGVKLMSVLFITACAIESSCGSFGSTYLVEQRGLASDAAAAMIMFYYGGLALGRLTSGLIGERWHSWKIVCAGQYILGIGILLLLLSGSVANAAGLFLIGFGNGPIFPNLLYLTPMAFSEEKSTAVTGAQMAVSGLSSMTAPDLMRSDWTALWHVDAPVLFPRVFPDHGRNQPENKPGPVERQECILKHNGPVVQSARRHHPGLSPGKAPYGLDPLPWDTVFHSTAKDREDTDSAGSALPDSVIQPFPEARRAEGRVRGKQPETEQMRLFKEHRQREERKTP